MSNSILTTVYRSDTKQGLYLYLANDKCIDDIPEELLKKIGKYTQVMEIDLNQREKLAQVDIDVVRSNLSEQGYHIQFPIDLVKNVISYT